MNAARSWWEDGIIAGPFRAFVVRTSLALAAILGSAPWTEPNDSIPNLLQFAAVAWAISMPLAVATAGRRGLLALVGVPIATWWFVAIAWRCAQGLCK